MAKIQLSTAVTLEITDNGKVVDTFKVTHREPSKKQQRKLGKENKDMPDLFKLSQKLDRRIEVSESKVDALQELGNPKDTLKEINKLELIYIEKDKVEDKFDALGGYDKFLEISQLSFDMQVGGKDKERLAEFIEENSDYGSVLEAIAVDAKAKRGN